ncbi:MAG: ABC transporter substrate-binding protein [Rhodocyclaceae bacterium]|nr:ABC transporter substrate-binding protein [Rhodocyclaceae bacterium]
MPDALVRDVTQEVLEIVKKDKDIQSGHTKKTLELVETKILPHFDFLRMTRLALGREAKNATPEQLSRLSEEFRTLLVRTYSKALSEYREQKIVVKPLVVKPEDTEVRVRSEIHQSGGKPVTLDYYLEKKPEGWKVFDVEVAGVSLVTNYRSTFAEEIRAGGIEGLIRSLAAKNRASAETKAK